MIVKKEMLIIETIIIKIDNYCKNGLCNIF